MNREAQDNLLMLAGATVLAIGATDLHLRYVKPQMQPLLILSGLVLLGIGLRGMRRTLLDLLAHRTTSQTASEDAETHPPRHRPDGDDDHAPTRTAWLLALPLLVLYLVAPPTLGAYAAARSDTSIAEPNVASAPLPAAQDGAVTLTLTDYYTRVLYDADSLDGVRVRLSGFVTPFQDRWFVTRMVLACCAADGRPVKVLTSGRNARSAPASDSWVEVTGRFTAPQAAAGTDRAVATLEVESFRPIPKPRNAYE